MQIRVQQWPPVIYFPVLFVTALLSTAHGLPRYGPLEVTGNISAQQLIRHPDVDTYSLVQQRNTLKVRVDYSLLEQGKLIQRYEIPFLKQAKLFMLSSISALPSETLLHGGEGWLPATPAHALRRPHLRSLLKGASPPARGAPPQSRCPVVPPSVDRDTHEAVRTRFAGRPRRLGRTAERCA